MADSIWTRPLALLWVAVLWSADAGAQQAAGGGLDSLVYQSRRDWLDHWSFPKGTLEIDALGTIRPTRIEKDINASLNASQFAAEKDRQGNVVRLGGILGAGSDMAHAANILDGDANTFWSPVGEVDTWWVEVDLGRLVTATRIAVKFNPEKPIGQFALYASDGQEALFPGSGVKDYKVVGQTTQPNREPVLEYSLERDRVDGRQVPRQHVRYLFFQVTAAAQEPGQLAELEVRALGDNLMLGTLDRFGSLVLGLNGEEVSGQKVADGDFLSRENLLTVQFDWRKRGWLRVDLGSLFWMDTVRIIGFEAPQTVALVGYKIFVSDGTTVPGSVEDPVLRDFAWQQVGALERNPPPGENRARFIFENSFKAQPVRYVFFSNRNNESRRGPAVREEISEIQFFGEGFVAGARLTSELIELGSAKNIHSVYWRGRTPPGTALEIRTRTGDQVDEIVHYYCRNGQECSKRDYDKEASLFSTSGPTVVELRPDTTWSGWSQPYLRSGDLFASPSPRKFLLIEARLVGWGPDLAPALNSLKLLFANPVARALRGWVSPTMVSPAVVDTFAYVVEPVFAPGHAGFDEILIRTPAPARLLGVRIGGDGLAPEQLDSVYTSADSLWLRLPVRVRNQVRPQVEILFATKIFDDNTLFEALVANSQVRGSAQRVDPRIGGAATVRLAPAAGLVEGARVVPAVFTPNGDGANDVAVVSFKVLKLSRVRPVEVDIYDLRGRQVQRLPAGEVHGRTGLSGFYQASWDGRDAAGNRVRPGLYLCRISVDAEVEKAVVVRPFAVAY